LAININKLLGKKHPMMSMFFSSVFGSSEKTKIEKTTTTDKKTKKKHKDAENEASASDADMQEKTTRTEVLETESSVSGVEKPQNSEAIQMHGEIK